MKKFVSAVTVTAAILSVLSLSACDNDTPSSESTVSEPESVIESSIVISKPQESSQISWEKSNSAEKAITTQQIDEMSEAVSSYQNMPVFNSEGSSFNAKSVSSGKTITLIPDNLNLLIILIFLIQNSLQNSLKLLQSRQAFQSLSLQKPTVQKILSITLLTMMSMARLILLSCLATSIKTNFLQI